MGVTIMGFDPGLTGGIAVIHNGKLVAVHEMPVLGGKVDGLGIDEILSEVEPDVCYVEQLQAFPKNGVIASFSLGYSYGVTVGVIQANAVKLVQVRPTEWKKKMGLTGKDKNASRGLARELFPEFASSFKLVKHDGVAEAALIARFGAFNEFAAHHEGQRA